MPPRRPKKKWAVQPVETKQAMSLQRHRTERAPRLQIFALKEG
jgi:hypothetical protein